MRLAIACFTPRWETSISIISDVGSASGMALAMPCASISVTASAIRGSSISGKTTRVADFCAFSLMACITDIFHISYFTTRGPNE